MSHGRTQHSIAQALKVLLFLGLFLVLGDIRMVLPRQFSKCFFNLVVSGCPGDAEHFVVIFEFYRHRAFSFKAGVRLLAT